MLFAVGNKYSDRVGFKHKEVKMARSATFKWGGLDKFSIIEMLKPCRRLLVDQKLKVSDIQKIFSKQIKSHLPIKVTRDRDFNTQQGYIYVGGFYHTFEDMYGRQCIELRLSYHPFENYLTITSKRFAAMCNTIADTILHEIIHMRQARSRSFRQIPGFSSYAESNKQRRQQNYLGDPDEIDAHGFNIACSLYERLGSYNAVANHLNENMEDGRKKKDTWKTYLEAFDHNHRHPVIQKLKKRVMYYVPYAELGKPYKTTDWLKH